MTHLTIDFALTFAAYPWLAEAWRVITAEAGRNTANFFYLFGLFLLLGALRLAYVKTR